jgi:hypothetical protein
VLHIQASGKNHQIPREEGKLTRHPELVSGVLCKTRLFRHFVSRRDKERKSLQWQEKRVLTGERKKGKKRRNNHE